MKRLYFVRHGQSQANVDRVYAGQVETPITEIGRQQAQAAGQVAKDLGIDHIISSPLSRAYDTAVIIAEAVGYPKENIERSDLLVERGYGTLVGKPWGFTIDVADIEGVETVESVLERGRLAYEYLRALPYETVLVVAHGTFYSGLKAAIDPTTRLVEGQEPDNAEIVQLI